MKIQCVVLYHNHQSSQRCTDLCPGFDYLITHHFDDTSVTSPATTAKETPTS